MKGMIRHFESTQSNKFAMSLQYLIKEVMEFIMEFIKIKTSTSWIIDFWWKPDMSKIPKKGSLLRFCNIYICIYNIYIKKKYCNCFCVLLWYKTFRYFTGFQSYLLSLSFANTPTVPIFVLVSRIESICPGFYICHQKKFHIYIIFHQQCKTINLRVIHTLNATKNITLLSSTKMSFWKHSIQMFKCYFERHIFDLIINSLLKTLKQKVTL